jgi:hypothetical protein
LNPTPTSISPLDRLELVPPDASDWHRGQGIDLPWIGRWLARMPGLGDEADDPAQDFSSVVVHLPRFERRREGSFGARMQQITMNRARSRWRRRQRMAAVGLDRAFGFLDRRQAADGNLAREWNGATIAASSSGCSTSSGRVFSRRHGKPSGNSRSISTPPPELRPNRCLARTPSSGPGPGFSFCRAPRPATC